ncbi:hypothetical protein HGRIS_000444 [Hohenbuehelia grisea]|uniref:Uncharacterized protein n=1 Tax=Hohenbuehelia grisea TaxID=104357 RepID=A0ABR3JRV5_9AGAR
MFIAGSQAGPEPNHGVCLFQAAMVYAAPGLTSSAALAFSLEMYLLISFTLQQKRLQHRHKLALLCMPYCVLFVLKIEILVLGLKTPSSVRRDNETYMYCHLESHIPFIHNDHLSQRMGVLTRFSGPK